MKVPGVRRTLARLGEDLVALFYPPQCLWCCKFEAIVSGRFLCESCWQRVHDEDVPALRDWSVNPPTSDLAEHCAFDTAAWHYHGAMSVLLPAMKYRDHPSFASIFGEIAAQRMRAQLDFILSSEPVLVPVPLHPVRQRERGFNQSVLIAQTLKRIWNLMVLPRALRRVKYTEAQARLSGVLRRQNLTDAFAPGRGAKLNNRAVILVDDVITTGATISACARIIKAAGAEYVGALALARA